MKIFRYGSGLSLFLLWLLVTPAQAGIRVERKSGDLSNGLVGYWTFDGPDISGTTAYDRSGQGNNGTIASATLTIGKLGQALNLDGVNDTVTVADHPSLDCTSAVTVSAWFYPRSLNGGWHVIAAKGIGNNSNYGLWHDGTKFTITFANGASWINHYTNQTYSPGRWYHLVGILDSANDNARLYVDGQLDIDNQTETTDTPTNNDPFYITSNYGGNWADGIIDDVRVYNRALSADEVKRLYNIGKGVSTAASQQNKQTSGLVGYWTFDGPDISGTTAYDRSGQGHNGTIEGATKSVGKLGQGLSFDGSNDVVATGSDLIGTNTVTICAWVKPRSAGGGNEGGVLGNIATRLCINNEAWAVTSNSGSTYAHSDAAVAYNSWQHVCGVRLSNGQATLYIDGAVSGAENQKSGTPFTFPNNVGIASRGDGGYPFDGIIDDVRLYTRALSADEVKRLYNMGR
jgi:hypothetical protein